MSKDVVLPGSYLGSEEEYVPGSNVYADGEGNVYADSTGIPVFDQKHHSVSVQKPKEVKILEEGAIVTGIVSLVKDNVALVDMRHAEKNGQKLNIHMSMGVMAVFNVANMYVKSLSSMFRVGDIVKARVASVSRHTIDLETRSSPELGVIKAYCGRCRKPLKLFGETLKCAACSNEEGRKLSVDYLLK